MAVFTSVSPAQLAQWLDRHDLGAVLDFRGISSGIENTNYFLTTERGEFVLTLFEKLTAEQLPFYLQLMRHLAHHGVPVPDPVPDRDDAILGELNGKPAAIVTKLSGRSQLAPNAEHCAQVGAMLARMHLAGRDFPLHQPNLRSLPWWREAAPAVHDFLSAPERALLDSEMAHQSAFFASGDYAALPEGPCHCDLFRDNVLFDDGADGHPRLGGFFDFYFAGCDKWLFDLAVTVNDWCSDLATGALDEERTLAMLRAYQTVVPLGAVEASHWRDMLRAGALRFWLSRLYDFHLPRSAEMLQPHDPGHFERILRQRIEVASMPWL
ncbi:serine kinase [Pandoraea terrae]|uniref:Homoserine kinase n=1 Tax=Pandoraea terrae TaxID=1537710 RepID=A0A5E4XRH0_9BURK|nr:homoserine kinase [Pandoraea terrae]VVE38940.1 serine kinase [Pandoraea terrae]